MVRAFPPSPPVSPPAESQSTIPDAAALRRRGIVVMVLSVSGFTINTLLLKYLGSAREVPALLPLLFRAAVGMAIVAVFFRGARAAKLGPVFTDRLLFWRGLTGVLGTAAYYWTVPSLGAGKATLICNTYAIFAAGIAALWLGETLTPRRLGWLCLALAGIALLTGPDLGGSGFVISRDDLIAVVGAMLAAASVVLIRRLTAAHHIGTIYLAQCVWIFLPVLPLTVGDLGGLTAGDWGLLTLAAAAAGYGQLAMNEGYRCLTVSTGASLQMLWPVMTALGGLAWFDERFTALQIAGAVLILAATWFVSTQKA